MIRVEIHHYLHLGDLSILEQVLSGVTKMAGELDRLSSEVAENTSVTQSAITLLGNLSEQLRALANDPAAINALADTLDANSNALAAAVTANTPTA